ncbi:MAG: membrane dipeptidase [Rudaea sp.]
MHHPWTRREFLEMTGTAMLASALYPFSTAAEQPVASSRATGLYRQAFVLDCNTLASIGELCCEKSTPTQLQAVRESGLTALKSTLGGGNGTFEAAVGDIAAADALIERFPQLFIKVRGYGDLDRAKSENKVAVIYSFEAASMLEGKVERIGVFRNLGVRVMQLSYNHESPFGYGCLDGETGGVSEPGRKAIAKMNAIGVALDLSHANTKTTADGIAISKKPALITHAGCRAVFMHPRNKRDEEMKALADRGGVMGIYMLPFLTPDNRQPHLDDYMQHMVHALKVCGEDHVGIGTDSMFFTVTDKDLQQIKVEVAERSKAGIGAPGENRPPYLPDINTPRKLEYVTDALLRHGYSERVTDKVLGLNFRRAFKEIWVA